MKIAVIAHIRNPIAEPFKGGMEAHCALLCRGLRAAGHEVTLFASEGSCDPRLVPICAPYDDVLPWEDWHGTPELAAYQQRAFRAAFTAIERGDFDVVHNNALYPDLIDWLADAAIPFVTSQHVPPFGAMSDAVSRNLALPTAAFTVTSRDQSALWTARGCGGLRVVHNGVDTGFWRPAGKASGTDRLTWIGRIVSNKGTAKAAAAAHAAGAGLDIFGPVEDEAYFCREVAPYLNDIIVYRGHCPADTLRRAVASARAALVTPMWDEPFGLVAAEALACGTPVIGFDRGALSEVVGPCGVLVLGGDVAALTDAIANAPLADRAACRFHAAGNLSTEAMIAGYEAAYAAVGAKRVSVAAQTGACIASNCSSTSALLA